jgi:hypothetical protein
MHCAGGGATRLMSLDWVNHMPIGSEFTVQGVL